mgnify:CR=1 FL=1
MEQLSRAQLLVVVTEQAAQIVTLTVQVEVLAGQVADLNAKVGRNSQNSSMPPSSDRFVKPARPVRGRSGRKPGKQPGAPGASLEFTDSPDEIVDHVPVACAGCGSDLADAEPVGVSVRQVRDVPLVKVSVTEHRMHRRACGCGHINTAPAPAGVDGPVCYGPNLRAVAVYLVVFQHVPVERAARLISDLTGAQVSTGWVSAQVGRTAEALVDVEKLIRTLVTAATVIGVDETTLNVNGAKQWLHVARTELLTAYHLHFRRGRVAVADFGILPIFTGTVMRDALAVYDSYPATHALCGAHLLRELTAISETDPTLIWPTQAREALLTLNTVCRTAREQHLSELPAELATEPLRLFRHAVLVGLATHPRADGRKQSKARNLLERLRDREPEILRFTSDLAVPFTNNGSERDLRPVKTQLKISGCHRATSGAQNWLRVRGYISTVGKHQGDILTALRDALTGNPWTPPAPAT